MELATTENRELGLMQQGASLFLDVARFEHAQRVAKMLATSTMVPAQFQGDRGIANCVIALNLAERMRVDPFMLMQNMYIVHGKPGIEAKLAIALMNGGGRFEPLEFEFEGEGDTRKCRAFAKEIKSGKTLYGTWVTWQMAKAERWVDKDGSKWKTMPDLMFTYRAAMFFARVYDPGALLGLRNKDELEDMVIDVTPQRTLKVDTDTGEIKDDIYAVKEEPPAEDPAPTRGNMEEFEEPETDPDLTCPHCGWDKATSMRGLRKHITQQHQPTAPPEAPNGEPDSTEESETADAPPETIASQINNIMNELGAGIGSTKYKEALAAEGITRESGGWPAATPLQQESVLKAMQGHLDAKLAES